MRLPSARWRAARTVFCCAFSVASRTWCLQTEGAVDFRISDAGENLKAWVQPFFYKQLRHTACAYYLGSFVPRFAGGLDYSRGFDGFADLAEWLRFCKWDSVLRIRDNGAYW